MNSVSLKRITKWKSLVEKEKKKRNEINENEQMKT